VTVALEASEDGRVVTILVNGEPTIWKATAGEIEPWTSAEIER
jgi:hypothetical protein